MESIRKLIIDSRFFVVGNASSGVFELPEVVEIHGTQALYLEQMSLMNTWFSVDETNNQFYVIEWRYGAAGTSAFNAFQPRIITIPGAPYDINNFLTTVQERLNGPDKFIHGRYMVSRTSTDPATGITSVALAQNFTILIVDSPRGENELFFPVPEKYVTDKKLVPELLAVLAGPESPKQTDQQPGETAIYQQHPRDPVETGHLGRARAACELWHGNVQQLRGCTPSPLRLPALARHW